jgi:hypothetical protein
VGRCSSVVEKIYPVCSACGCFNVSNLVILSCEVLR